MVQLWVNLPATHKMTPVKYQAIENRNMPVVILDDKKSKLELIAGEYNGIKGPAYTFSPINLFNARLYPGEKVCFSFDKYHNTGMLVIEGEVKINDKDTSLEDHLVYFRHDGENIYIEALKESIVLIMSGEPLNEPIAAYGPFLMNTEAEIKQAFDDFRNGKFGYLED
jgi:quercetin 2,3-dioxygenase